MSETNVDQDNALAVSHVYERLSKLYNDVDGLVASLKRSNKI